MVENILIDGGINIKINGKILGKSKEPKKFDIKEHKCKMCDYMVPVYRVLQRPFKEPEMRG